MKKETKIRKPKLTNEEKYETTKKNIKRNGIVWI